MTKSLRTVIWTAFLAGAALSALSSCTAAKDIIYFQDIDQYVPQPIDADYEPVIMKDDKLQIIISGPDKSVVIPYNFSIYYNPSGMSNANTHSIIPYLVDSHGCIDMPGLGRIKVEGMRRTDLVNHITNLLTERGLVKEPVVSVSFLNYKITVLGEVGHPGTFSASSERVTVLQALGMAGDLKLTADRHDILLIRDEEGKQTHYRIDLTDTDLLHSPYFFLHQNDVLYVPQSAKRIASGTTPTGLWSIILSTISSIITVTTFILVRVIK